MAGKNGSCGRNYIDSDIIRQAFIDPIERKSKMKRSAIIIRQEASDVYKR